MQAEVNLKPPISKLVTSILRDLGGVGQKYNGRARRGKLYLKLV